MGKRVCIIANSLDFQSDVAASCARDAELVIACDGAASSLEGCVVPHVICGDFDSITREEAAVRYPEAEKLHSECQDTNDLEKSIQVALARGASHIDIVCALGGRLDHSLVTLSLLEKYHREAALRVRDKSMTARVFSASEEQRILEVSPGDTISLIPRGDGATVSISSVQSPLARERLIPGSRGVSNKALADAVPLVVHEGVIYCIFGQQP